MPEFIEFERTEEIATLTLTQPTMPPAFFFELEELFAELNRDTSLRAVILRASGKAFSYGLDLAAAFQEYGHLFAGGADALKRTELLTFIRRLQKTLSTVAACPVPVIAAVQGWCIGGGLDLISACDIRLATRDTRFSLRETRVAMVADLGSLQRLPAIIGAGNLRELAFTGKDIDASRAKEMGLVNALFDDVPALHQNARAWAKEIASNPPLTVRGVKEVLRFGEGKSVEEGLQYVAAWNAAFLASEDLGEAIAAFLERRSPNYQGK